jgi:seryl-tRNA synthetase
MMVKTPTGPATVKAAIKYCVPSSMEMTKVNNELMITPYHPIQQDGAWVFPRDHFPTSSVALDAVYNLVLDTHVRENGFTEIWPPILINEASARGTWQIPDKEDQMYVVGRDGFYLAPTAEVPVTNMHRDEILDGADLPIRYAAYTPCFRREAGAAGRETRGILRLHQFDKVEMVSFERPAESAAALEWLTARAESLLKQLELPYRVLLMATGDMGFVQMRKYDLEVWAPGSKRWLEVSSCSNFGDYQARRMAIRYRTAQGEKPELVHTLNGSGLAVPRVLAALLEHGAQPDGSVKLPAALHPYLGGRTHLAPPTKS